ncbi:MAG TPA: nucleotidyltransferase domain-containing protein [Chloroflexia bacterium]|nr:nucleotidyltransferase domain-containing protein [Chloroflexia bacterium]
MQHKSHPAMAMSSNQILNLRLYEREELVARAAEFLKRDERVVAAWLFGSLGRGDADALSDVDLWVVVADEHIEAVSAERREFVAGIGKPLLIEEAPQNAPIRGAYLLALYGGEAGPHQVDWYWQPKSDAQVPADIRLLFDRVNLPVDTPLKSLTNEECAELATNQVAFFWAMCNIAAKKIARRQAWGTLSMFGLLSYALEETEWLAGLREERPGHKDTRTGLPPVQPDEQLDLLRQMAHSMERIMPQVEALSGTVPVEAIPQVYRFFEVVEAILEE